jgi:hypothetical protein
VKQRKFDNRFDALFRRDAGAISRRVESIAVSRGASTSSTYLRLRAHKSFVAELEYFRVADDSPRTFRRNFLQKIPGSVARTAIILQLFENGVPDERYR